MPSFVCDSCQETLKKPKLDAHVQRCRGASFSCIDCYKSFKGVEYRQHFSCITEVEKYEKRKPDQKLPSNVATNKSNNEKSKEENLLTPKPESGPEPLMFENFKKILKKHDEPLSLKDTKKILKKEYKLSKKEVKKYIEGKILLSLNNNDQTIKVEFRSS